MIWRCRQSAAISSLHFPDNIPCSSGKYREYLPSDHQTQRFSGNILLNSLGDFVLQIRSTNSVTGNYQGKHIPCLPLVSAVNRPLIISVPDTDCGSPRPRWITAGILLVISLGPIFVRTTAKMDTANRSGSCRGTVNLSRTVRLLTS